MESLTLTGLLNRVANQFPSRRAVSVSGKFDLTYSRLLELIERAASRLVSSGINAGDVVALTFPNNVEVRFLILIYSMFCGSENIENISLLYWNLKIFDYRRSFVFSFISI